ncbi:MAG: glutamate--cysteine ligase [Burkholderiaceae bacterium]|jgi:carboxylate-amine ligase|nr:glutamate--cysteine ligase [Burkholderiaceae bacterium]
MSIAFQPGATVTAAQPSGDAVGCLEDFASSEALTLGVELELQLVNTNDYDLAQYADDMLRLLARRRLPGTAVPEMTAGMLEIATGICRTSGEALAQLTQIRDALVQSADKLNIAVVGGGTHAFQKWHQQRIYDKPRFQQLSQLYGYLSKQFTIFGQHVHVGCPDADTALYTLHCLSRYVPHFIALAASSPFVQGQDTGFDSARLNSVFAFPLSGRAPCVLTWEEFGGYFDKMARTGVVRSMKDFYWDVRPKPEYGTIEVRVFDTPLTVQRAAALAGLVQSLAAWFQHERPFAPAEDDYLVYTYNRFQACRFGLDAVYVDPASGAHQPLREHLLATFDRLRPHAEFCQAGGALDTLRQEAHDNRNDARWLREQQASERMLGEVIRQAALRFRQ